MRADMDDPDVARCAPRLLRYAQALGGPQHLTVEFFFEQVHYSAVGIEALNTFDLKLFRKLGRRETPSDSGGLMRWRLRPKDDRAVSDLNKIIFGFLAEFCVPSVIVVQRLERLRAIKFRFLSACDSHAHIGVFVFGGRAVERYLAEKRRLAVEWELERARRVRAAQG